nr:MAG TPA: hypothetical protein [Caudoviricetes sp.]
MRIKAVREDVILFYNNGFRCRVINNFRYVRKFQC